MPLMMLKSVVLPAPFGPITPWIRPGITASETPSRTTMPPKLLRRVLDREDRRAQASALVGGQDDGAAPSARAHALSQGGTWKSALVLVGLDHVGLAAHELGHREEEALHEPAGHHLVGRHGVRPGLARQRYMFQTPL